MGRSCGITSNYRPLLLKIRSLTCHSFQRLKNSVGTVNDSAHDILCLRTSCSATHSTPQRSKVIISARISGSSHGIVGESSWRLFPHTDTNASKQLYERSDALHPARLIPIYSCLFADVLAMGGQLDGLLPLVVAVL